MFQNLFLSRTEQNPIGILIVWSPFPLDSPTLVVCNGFVVLFAVENGNQSQERIHGDHVSILFRVCPSGRFKLR